MFPNLKNLGKVEFKTKTDTIYKNFGRFDQIFDQTEAWSCLICNVNFYFAK